MSDVTIYMEHLEDGYPDWHPAPHSLRGMLRLFIYREITGDSYRTLETYQELADPFELEHVPDESVLSRTWRNRFDDGLREYITVAAHYVVKEVHDGGPAVSAVRPKEEITESDDDSPANDEEESRAFSDEQIHRTTRPTRDYGFDGFDSERAENASYEDTQFFELETFMGKVGCGTPQGATRFRFRRGEEYGPHGDTHLRAVKQFEPEAMIERVDRASERLHSVITEEASFRRPVTAAIEDRIDADVTKFQCWFVDFPDLTGMELFADQVMTAFD